MRKQGEMKREVGDTKYAFTGVMGGCRAAGSPAGLQESMQDGSAGGGQSARSGEPAAC